MTYEQLRQIKQLLLREPEREEFAVSQQWNIPVANLTTETLSNCFKPDGAPRAAFIPLSLPRVPSNSKDFLIQPDLCELSARNNPNVKATHSPFPQPRAAPPPPRSTRG